MTISAAELLRRFQDRDMDHRIEMHLEVQAENESNELQGNSLRWVEPWVMCCGPQPGHLYDYFNER